MKFDAKEFCQQEHGQLGREEIARRAFIAGLTWARKIVANCDVPMSLGKRGALCDAISEAINEADE